MEWMSRRGWSLTRYKLHISRCDVEKHCLIIFNAVVVQWKATRARCQHSLLRVFCSVASLFFWSQVYNFRLFFKRLWLFLFFKKGQIKFGVFGQLNFYADSADLKDDFVKFLGTGSFLDTVYGRKMINFYHFLVLCASFHGLIRPFLLMTTWQPCFLGMFVSTRT